MDKYQFLPVTILRTPAFSFLDYSPDKPAAILLDNNFQQAILIASQVLYERFKKVDFDWDRLNNRERHSLQKYINRACFRPTPFGAFAMVTPVAWGDDQRIHITAQQLHISPNFKAGMSIIRRIRESQGTKQRHFKANQSIYACGDELRYLDASTNVDGTGFDFTIRSVGNSSLVRRLCRFSNPARSYQELLDYLRNNGCPEDTEALLDELIDLGLLTDDLVPNITGRDYLQRTLGEQQESKPGETLATNYCNTTGVASGELNRRYQETLRQASNGLITLQGKTPKYQNLVAFIADFTAKFAAQVVPLLYVMDPEVGVGYQDLADNGEGGELIAGIQWPAVSGVPGPSPWTKTHSLLLNKWHNRQPVVLTLEDLKELGDPEAIQLPPSLSVLFRVIGDQVLVESAGGISACGLIGRFTPFNEDIQVLARSAAETEILANPDVIFAEIAHICDFKSADINRRMSFYSYEIPVLTASLQPEECQITLADLWVSVVNGEIILYSQKLGKRVIPRLSSAFNYVRNDLSVFRFLCDLQHQGLTSSLSLDLRAYFPDLDFYPRVEYGKAILHLASWYIQAKTFKSLQSLSGEDQWLAFREIATELQLPEWAALTVNDNQLVFHLTDRKQLPFFLEAIDNRETILLKEFIDQTGQTPVFNQVQRPLVNQFVAGLYTERQVYSGMNFPFLPKQTTTRKLEPGSEWLYFKIYGHVTSANELLATHLSGLVRQLFREGIINAWFFLRYADPKDHIRIRFHVCPNKAAAAVALAGKRLGRLLHAGKIADFNIAVYERELERYGHLELPALEHLFFESSELIMAYIRSGYPNYVAFGIHTVRILLDAFQLYGAERVGFLERQSQGFMKEFAGDNALRRQLDRRVRDLREPLSAPASSEIIEATDRFQQGAAKFYLDQHNKPVERLQQWLSDLIHLHLNRLFIGNPRKQECVLYYLLWKQEKALLARQKSF